MSSDAVTLRVCNVSKHYLLFDRPEDRLKQSIIPRLQRLFGQPSKQYYRDFAALSDLSFEIKRGETVGIIGRNGSGKSTLLQIICGTLHPSTGTVEVKGRVAALLELGSGFNPEFSGRENIYMNAAILGLTKDEIEARFDEIARFADIGLFLDQPVKTYSSGMVVRLAFAVIAHVNADILVIDEALAVGDAFFVQKCMRFLRNFMQSGTVLFVSHDTSTIINLCQRAIWLEAGTIKAIGIPKQVSEMYLASMYEAQQGPSKTIAGTKENHAAAELAETMDQRLQYVNHSRFRNDIELFKFDPSGPSFGIGGAAVIDVQLEDTQRKRLSWCVGGEDVLLRIRCKAFVDLVRPIVGFIVKDRLGQPLFADNSYLTYLDTSLTIKANRQFDAVFAFRMPILPAGDYSICAALAEGTQAQPVQHHWVHDALFFKSHSSSACTGLVGIPMRKIEITPID